MATSALPRPSAASAIGATSSSAAACFKCGVRGHWSRDCTASKAEQDAHRREREASEASAAAAAEAAAKAASDAAAAQALRRKKRLTLEDLKAPNGLPEVFASFPGRAAALGIGRCVREAKKRRKNPRAVPPFAALASDLSKLVDLYDCWSRRLLPGLPSFAARIDALEAAGKASALKLEMRGVRYNALKVLGEKEGEGEAGGGGEGDADATVADVVAAPVGGLDDDEDEADELLALQARGAEAEEEGGGGAAGATAATAAAQGREEEEEDFDDEEFDDLLELVGDGDEGAGGGERGGAAATEATGAAATEREAAAAAPASAAEEQPATETAAADDFDELLALVETQQDV